MGLDTPLAPDQDRRCRTLEAVQNTAEEGPRRGCCGGTAEKEGKERQMNTPLKGVGHMLGREKSVGEWKLHLSCADAALRHHLVVLVWATSCVTITSLELKPLRNELITPEYMCS